MTSTAWKITCVAIGVSAFIVGYIAGAWVYAVAGDDFWKVLKDWQTLLAGILAVVAALLTVVEIRRQIAQADKHRRDDLERDNYSARAVLPVALSKLTAYAKACVDELLVAADLSPETLSTHIFPLPDMPDEIILPVRDCVRFANGGRRAELADLLGDLQVQRARIVAFSRSEDRIGFEVAELCLDAIDFYGRASALFDYARREPEDELQTLQGVAMVCGAIHGMHDQIDERIALAAPRYLATLQAYRGAAFSTGLTQNWGETPPP